MFIHLVFTFSESQSVFVAFFNFAGQKMWLALRGDLFTLFSPLPG